jgi:sugar lactone lactonase YvrE
MQAGKLFSLPIRFGYATVFFALVLATLPFTLLAPAMVTFTHGAYARDAKGPRPTLDGLAWMRSEAPSDYAAVHWFNRFVPNTPNIVEKPDGYYNYLSRFSTNTGLPAIMGWAHHVGERLHQDEKYPRTRDADRIYLSENREEVKQLLAEYRVEYLVFGTIEQNNSRQGVRYGNPSRERLMQWPGLLSLVYHNGPTSIFRVNRSLHPDQPAPQRESLRAPSIATGIDAQASLFEGGEGSAPGQFRQPRGITIDANGYIYIADTFNHRLQAFRPGGPFLWQLGGEGNQQGQFREPNAVDIDPGSGNIYVADTWNHRVILLDKFGNWIGATDLMLYGPRGLAFHPEERRLYIADTGNHMIKVLESGTLVDQWGEPGGGGGPEAFREPIGIEVTHEGNLAIADSLNRRVKIYQPDGELLRVFPIETEFPDGGMEIHLLCTADGRIALTDPREGSIHVYGPEGNLLGKLQESVDGQSFEQPAGIDQGPQGRILVTDIGRNQVFEIRLDALSQAEE